MAADEKRQVILSYEENDSPNLLQMGGTKKRKRDTSPDKDTCGDAEPDNNDEHLQTPRPSVFSRLSLKRTSSEAFGEDGFSDNLYENRGEHQMNYSQSNDSNKKRNRRRPRAHKNRNMNQIQSNDQHQHDEADANIPGRRRAQQQEPNINTAQRNDLNQHSEADMNTYRPKGRRPLKKRNMNTAQRNYKNEHSEADMNISRRGGRRPQKKRNMNTAQRNDRNERSDQSQHNEAVTNDSNPEEDRWQQDDSQPQLGNRPQQGKFRSRNRRPKKKNKNNVSHMPGSSLSNKQFKQESNEASFEPYDYSSVDFKAFQGGAERAHKPQQIKSNFRGKGRSRRGRGKRGGNKQSVFGNVKGNTKGR